MGEVDVPPDVPQSLGVTRRQREALNGHRGGVVYMTGLSGAGKSTIATLVEQRLHALSVRTCVLDGDVLRKGISRDLGYSDADRIENMRRVTEVARLMVDAGLVVVVALISPFGADRQAAKDRFDPTEFMEVFIDAPLAVCERRDPKGLYQRARRGEIPAFTGIDSRYEPPLFPDLRVDSTLSTPQEAAAALLAAMIKFGIVSQAQDIPDPILRVSLPRHRVRPNKHS
jgi:adenylyl-sulfate kinase